MKILLLSTGGGGGNILRSVKMLFDRDLTVTARTDPAYAERVRAAVTTRFLDTNEFSLADVAFAPYVTRLDHLQMAWMWDQRPKVADWFDRVRARRSYAQAYDKWLAKPVIDIMREKGKEATARVKQILGM